MRHCALRTFRNELRKGREKLYGIQIWVALPKQYEETDPDFAHYPADLLPKIDGEGKIVRIIAGSLFGKTSPVQTFSQLFYADAAVERGASLVLSDDYEERAIYLLEGDIEIHGQKFEPGRLLVFSSGDEITIKGISPARFVLSAENCSTARVTSGGTLSQARARGSSKPNRIGRAPGSRRFQVIPSLSRFPGDRRRSDVQIWFG